MIRPERIDDRRNEPLPGEDDMSSSPIDHIIDVASGAAEADASDVENRGTRRFEYGGEIALVQWTPTGGKSIPTTVRCKNVSSSGMCVVSRYMLHVGHEGAILIKRSNGEEVILGVKVVHCSYVGDMDHESGVEFVECSDQFSLEDFRDAEGNLPPLRAAA
jgi:hypothetical protein